MESPLYATQACAGTGGSEINGGTDRSQSCVEHMRQIMVQYGHSTKVGVEKHLSG